MLALSESEISNALAPLSVDACDTLMKYLYKLMADKSKSCPIVLKVHAQLVEKAGHGSIMRAMAERKTV